MGKIVIYIMCLFLSLPTFGSVCEKPVLPIKAGQAADCDGYRFSPDAESDAYKASKLADIYKDENKILQERLNLYIQESKTLSEQVAKRDSSDDLYRILYFCMGVVATSFLARNVK